MNLDNGIYTALITPFDKNLKVDFKMLEILINKQISSGVKGIVLNTTTSEGMTLSKKEKEKILKFAIKIIDKKIKIFTCVGSSSTTETISEIKLFNKYNIDGFLFNLPYFNKPNINGLKLHIDSCCKVSNKPIILYYVPQRTGQYLSFENLKSLCQNEKIVALKDASSNLEFFSKCLSIKPDFKVFCGSDIILDGTLRLGGAGAICVTSNVCPQKIVEIYNLFCEAKFKKAQLLFSKIFTFIESLFIETNPIAVKFALCCLNLNVGMTRLPLAGLLIENKSLVRDAITKCEITL